MNISEEAILCIKKLAKSGELYDIYASKEKFRSFSMPSTFFMAGSPGAGKTEASKNFIKNVNEKIDFLVVRIDADEIRNLCPGYTGSNSHLFQGAVSLGVNKLYDYVLRKKYNVVLDSTFSSYQYAESNVKIALDKKREVHIIYIYQDPKIAWEFTQKRERLENRKITLDVFVDDFIKDKENVNKIKEIFGGKIKISLIKKDYNNGIEKLWVNIDKVDNYIKFEYNKKSLYNVIKDIKII